MFMRSPLRRAILVFALITAALAREARVAMAEVSEISVAQQFGVAFLPLIAMRNGRLIEKQAQKMGIGTLKVNWHTFGSGADMNTALISQTLDLASGGTGPVLQIWDRTKGNLDVKGVAALGSLPLYLNSINPKVRTIRDLTNSDRIALPAVKVSIQAVLLQMAAAQTFGFDRYNSLDPLTVSLNHPQALAALLSGTEITAHFAAAPFQDQELKDPRVRRILHSYDVLGGPGTLNSLYTTSKFRSQNPKVLAAVLAALREAMGLINRDKRWATRIYIEEEKSKLDPALVHSIISNPDINFTAVPQGFMKFADFMFETKMIRERPSSWKDVFFPEIHAEAGS
jgi:NitT/TauT family transport system substrate-binding protein